MFRKTLLILNKTVWSNGALRGFGSSNPVPNKWDLITAVCVERRPLITIPLNTLETEYKNLQKELEFEKSLKSEHELRHEKEQHQIEQMKKGDDVDVLIKQTAQEMVDANIEELAQFKFAPKVTEADQKGDLHSLNRKLDKYLVLVTKQKLGKDEFYLLPQSLREDGETLRQTAERTLKSTVGEELKAQIYGNAPFGFYKYKYPKDVRKEDSSVGAKIFIFFARYENGTVGAKNLDYKWLDRLELENCLPAAYHNSVAQMLIDE